MTENTAGIEAAYNAYRNATTQVSDLENSLNSAKNVLRQLDSMIETPETIYIAAEAVAKMLELALATAQQDEKVAKAAASAAWKTS